MSNFPGVCPGCRQHVPADVHEWCPHCGWPAQHVEARFSPRRRPGVYLPALVQVFLDMAIEHGRLTDALELIVTGKTEQAQLDLLLPCVTDPDDAALRAAILDRNDVLLRRPTVSEIELKYLERLLPEAAQRDLFTGARAQLDIGQIRVGTFYDTLDFGPDVVPHPQWSTRLFGNANIGMLPLTNLQVAGQLGSDAIFFITEWWVSCLPRPMKKDFRGPRELGTPSQHAETAKDQLARSCATVYVGDHPQQQLTLY